MAIKYGRPLESKTRVVPVDAPAPGDFPLELPHRAAAVAPHRMAAPHGARECADARGPDWPIFVVDGKTAPNASSVHAGRRSPVDR